MEAGHNDPFSLFVGDRNTRFHSELCRVLYEYMTMVHFTISVLLPAFRFAGLTQFLPKTSGRWISQVRVF